MDISEDQRASNLKGALKLFRERLQEQTWEIQGIPEFVTMTHRDKCALCKQYAAHTIEVAKCPTVAIPSHQIEVPFWTAWPQTVTCIEDEAVDKAHGKLSWYWDRYNEVMKTAKLLEEKLSSEEDYCQKTEARQAELEIELETL